MADMKLALRLRAIGKPLIFLRKQVIEKELTGKKFVLCS